MNYILFQEGLLTGNRVLLLWAVIYGIRVICVMGEGRFSVTILAHEGVNILSCEFIF